MRLAANLRAAIATALSCEPQLVVARHAAHREAGAELTGPQVARAVVVERDVTLDAPRRRDERKVGRAGGPMTASRTSW